MISQKKITFVTFLYVVCFIVPFIILLENSTFTTYFFGQLTGVLGLTAIVVQFALSSRHPLLEKGVGLDRLMEWHKYNGYLVLGLLLLHPTLLFWEDIISFDLVSSVRTYGGILYYWYGVAALMLLLLVVVTSIFSRRLSLSWEAWRVIHWLAYGVVFLGGLHSLNLGSHIAGEQPLYYWWFLLMTFTVGVVLYRWVYIPLLIASKWLPILSIEQEADDVTTIRFAKPNNFDYLPGQFAFVQIKSAAVPKEEHHFTMSSSPTENFLAMSIKNLGDYTADLAAVKPGDSIQVEGPYGVYSHVGVPGPYVFLAGGIGMTPIRSMLKYMIDTGHDTRVKLLYSVQRATEIAFKQELAAWQEKYGWLSVELFLTKESKHGFTSGRIQDDDLVRVSNDYREATYFVSGPAMFVKAMKTQLINLSVQESRIYTEKFSLR